MNSTFDIERLNELLKDFHDLTQMRITIFDDNFQELASYPKDIAPICQYIRDNPKAAEACRLSDLRASEHAKNLKSPYVYQCHAGLTEAVAPVYMGNILIAYLYFGHLFSYDSHVIGWMNIRNLCKKYEYDEDDLKVLTMDMPITPKEKITSASHILEAVASYLCLERMITLHQKDLSVQIDDYINENFAEDLSAKSLCNHFHIGKTALYELSKKNYSMGIAEHVRDVRIHHAKELLQDHPEMTIAEIAVSCGYNDYNYFITVFKKSVGTSPLKYRKSLEA